MRVAAVDVGSNSIHMVVAEVEADGRFRVLDRAKEMVRLGGRTHNEGRLSDAAMDAGAQTLATFRTLADRLGVNRVQAVATSAVREAANGGDFIRRVKNEVGWRIKVIQGLEEARLIYLGVRHVMDLASDSPSLIVDIGGGSVELILVEEGEATWFESLKLGVARLSDRFLEEDPPPKKVLESLDTEIEAGLASFHKLIKDRGRKWKVRRIVGTSGTMDNLVAMASHSDQNTAATRNSASTIDAAAISRVRKQLSRTDRANRLEIKGLDSKRVDLIIAGACVADQIISTSGAKAVVSCNWALREGVLLDFIDRHQKGIEEVERYHSPRLRSVMRLARHLGETSRHGKQVAHLATRLFDQLQDDLNLAPEAKEWLEYAALLHDIGHHISHKNHHRHSHYLIVNSELHDFEPEEVEIIALIARYHRKASPKDSDPSFGALPDDRKSTVRKLSSILRVADGLDRSHFGVVKDIVVERRKNEVIFELDGGDNDAALEIWEAQQRAKALGQVLDKQISFAVQM